MTITRNRLKRVVAGLTTTAVVGSLAVFATSSGTVSAAPGPDGATLSVSSGTESTLFDVGLVDPGSQTCPVDSVTGGAGTANENFRASSFIVDDAFDPADLTWAGTTLGLLGAPDGDPSALPLISTGGLVVNSLPAAPNGNIVLDDFTDITFNSLVGEALSNGVWNIGIACYDGDTPGLPTERFWSTQITISNYVASPLSFDWGVGTPADAPVLSLGAGTGTEQTINIVPDATIDSYNVTVNPSAGVTVGALAPGDSSFELSGLTIGTPYDVTVEAVKAAGNASSSINFTAAVLTAAPVVTVLDVFDGDDVIVNWTEPAGPVAPVSYDVEISDGGGVVASSLGVVGLTETFSGLALGGYTASVTPNYPAGSGVSGQTGTDGFSVNPNALIVQEVSVTRPPGALIITQRCGVFGDLDPFTAVDAFPGFPIDLPAEDATLDQVGTSPDIDLATAGVQVDPEFDNYPFPTPATYPTECGLDMGTASFVTSGALAGQFYAASGRLNEVTVLDTRDNDDGWTARGDIEDTFTGSTGDSFDGDYLGWIPVVTDDSDPVGGSTYDQVVSAGGTVLPGAGSIGNPSLTDNVPLAFAAGGAGLGIATLDARMLLLIPASADAADYNATLTLTVA